MLKMSALSTFMIWTFLKPFVSIKTPFVALMCSNRRCYSWEPNFSPSLCHKLDSQHVGSNIFPTLPIFSNLLLLTTLQCCAPSSVILLSYKKTKFFPTFGLLYLLLRLPEGMFLFTLHVVEAFLFSTVQFKCHIPREAING